MICKDAQSLLQSSFVNKEENIGFQKVYFASKNINTHISENKHKTNLFYDIQGKYKDTVNNLIRF